MISFYLHNIFGWILNIHIQKFLHYNKFFMLDKTYYVVETAHVLGYLDTDCTDSSPKHIFAD